MIAFIESKEKTEETEKCLDSQLWHACAGSMVQIPPVNSKVFYFPQGHLEHSRVNVDLRNCPKFPAYVPCRVSAIKFMADFETDEVFAKIRLIPITGNEVDLDSNGAIEINASESRDKPTSFAKTLTQSDANNGGGFSVPRYCAETVFPRLDYSADPPVQTILAKDVHGEVWKFRHIYRGTPRRHLLTTGWSAFVNHKKLVAGDSIVFLRAENGDLCIGIRRAKKGISGGFEVSSNWNPTTGNCLMQYGGFSAFRRENDSKGTGNSNGEKPGISIRVKHEDVIEAATLAVNGKPFDVVYYPRTGTPEYFVKDSLVKAALQICWCTGIRFKRAFETEDSSRLSWFMGTILSVQVADPFRWPNSPWRLLQVRWDEPDLLQNVKRVNPWLVELVSDMSSIHLSPFSSPPHKKMRLPLHPNFPLDGEFPFSGTHLLGSSNPFGCLVPENAPSGMQGARHGQYGLFSLSFPPLNRATEASNHSKTNESVSCLLTMGSSAQETRKTENKTTAPLVLFGRQILTEKQVSLSCSSDTVSTSNFDAKRIGNASDGSDSVLNRNDANERSSCEGYQSEVSLETGHCKVFMESEDVGRTLDLSLLRSYEELYKKLGNMFGIETWEILNHILYQDTSGGVRQLGEEPFRYAIYLFLFRTMVLSSSPLPRYLKTARRLTVIADSSSDNIGV